jgi:hypothetical protein
MSFFVDWDRARSARRDLIDAFLRSNWPPHRLLVASLDAGIDALTLEQLSRTSSGRAYIHSIEAEMPRLSLADRKRVQASLTQFFA